MKLFDGTNVDTDKHGAGNDGFQNKDVGMGQGGSKPDADWFDMVQFEIAFPIVANGGTLATGASLTFPDDYSQLHEYGLRPGNAWYGDGHDGTLTVNGADETLTEDAFYSEIVFETDHHIETNGYKLHCQGRMYHSGSPSGSWGVRNNGGDASGATGGTGTNLGTTVNAPSGATGDSDGGAAGTATSNGLGGNGGAGGDSGGNTGGAGGIVTAPSGVDMRLPHLISDFVTNDRGTVTAVQPGASGGAGGGDGGNNGGGGGAGGGGVMAAIRNIELGVQGVIQADGGDGGDGAGGNAAGGGGGGGGAVGVLCRTVDVPANITATGGAVGASQGTGTAAVAGVDGTVLIVYV